MNFSLSLSKPPKLHGRIFCQISDLTCQPKPAAIVVGAGLAGLAAANRLHAAKVPFLLLEASDGVGGRVRSDTVDGFVLDRGFQIFITAYPEAQRVLDYKALDLQKFYSGALVYYNGQFHRLSDPARHLLDSILSLGNPIGSIVDKLLIGLTRLRVVTRSDDEILTADEVPILELLNRTGFSKSTVDRFFRPFFGGIFFDRELETTSRLFDFIFKCLALGDNTVPSKGIGAIPNQLVENLPPNSLLLNSKVVSITPGDKSRPPQVKMQSGEILTSEHGVIVAIEEPEATKLLGRQVIGSSDVEPSSRTARSTICLYFSADKAPVEEPILILNGSGRGIVNNMFFATEVARSYGPRGKTLVSVSVVGLYEQVSDEEMIQNVLKELSEWFGESVVAAWRHLRTYRIGFAQPNQSPPTQFVGRTPRVGLGLYLCGDYRLSATFDGALVSGRVAAEALLEDKKDLVVKERELLSFTP